ncbi:hypothetical protein AHAT_35790 [Agarivorans sp. Toyoura001]|uniref:choice-of-anchor Q domain-containing protein n=1 Tax=Agarivorans sp. Toyoura001 TaxID=2283141 RepID=UPI0010E36678|nr:choice-of-anchor Q domain-containing protein [Agarivorans sp. Toyoura001]GDY27689.1 hypothetical protein AHAT_35790 [Agarivorans sp. Toyoura001]
MKYNIILCGLFAASIHTLVGCGGSSGSSSISEARAQYEGSEELAVVNSANAHQFSRAAFYSSQLKSNGELSAKDLISPDSFLYLMFGIGDFPGLYSSLSCDSGNFEEHSDVDTSTWLGEVSVSFNECLINNATVNGSYTLTIKALNSASGHYLDNYSVKYTDFSISSNSNHYSQLNGNVDFRITRSLTKDTRMNLIMTDENQAQQILLDNVSWLESNANSENMVEVKGSIYLGAHGRVDLTSDQLLMSGLNVDDGHFTVKGDSSSYSTTFNPNPKKNNLELFPFDESNSTVREAPLHFLTHRVLSNLNDSDGDGMWDGWEIYYGLDHLEANGEDDDDGDGWSNYLEFVGIDSSPVDATSKPSINIGIPNSFIDTLVGLESSSYTLRLFGNIDKRLADAISDFSFTVSFPETIEWNIEESDHCSIENNLLKCNVTDYSDFIGYQNHPLENLDLAILEFKNRSLDVGETKHKIALDFNNPLMTSAQEEPSFSRSLTLHQRPYTESRINANDFAVVLDDIKDEFFYKLEIDSSRYLEQALDISLPSSSLGMEIVGINVLDDEMVCTFSSKLAQCDVPSFRNPSVELVLSKPSAHGKVSIGINVKDYKDGSLVYEQQFSSLLAITSSMAELKAQADELEVGETILNIAPGIYSGSVTFDRNLTLKGDANTELWLKSGAYADGASITSTSELHIDGLNLHVIADTDSAIKVSGGSIVNSDIHISGYRGSMITSDKPIRITHNSINVKDTNGTLINLPPGSSVNNNLIVLQNSRATLIGNSLGQAESEQLKESVKVSNNTLIDMYSFFSDHSLFPLSAIVFENNIVALTDNLESVDDSELDGSVFSVSGEQSVTRHNLFSSRFTELLNNSEFVNESNIVSDKISQGLESDFSLNLTSEAVDNGVDNLELPSKDLAGSARVSGLGVDIGAFELQQ